VLKNLRIQNYALIRQLDIEFESGFTIITGETGAGKSILLGALALLLGQRADTGILFDKSKKCIVEASFAIGEYGFQSFFEEHDIDYDKLTIIRREIASSGKSRAFINDTPATLPVIKTLGLLLVDIHSQHQNLQLGNNQFQLTVVDTVAGNIEILGGYKERFREYQELSERINEVTEKSKKARTDLEYLQFQYEQLESAKLVEGELGELEEEASVLNNAEEITRNLHFVTDSISGDESGILTRLKDSVNSLEAILGFYPKAGDMHKRLNSVYIELKDISDELEGQVDGVELNPQRQELINERIDLINNLLLKHSVTDVEDLIRLRDEYLSGINEIGSYDELLEQLNNQLADNKIELKRLSKLLSEKRITAIPDIEKSVSGMLNSLGIPHARFVIKHSDIPDFSASGCDRVEFLFSANKQAEIQEISKVASGGELSRLMLTIKSLLSDSLTLPTIIFDEVDSGVSGEIADKVANIMKAMSGMKQVINITHLPQVAGKGDYHYLVYKYERGNSTHTDIKLLDNEERVLELAKMLSGEELTEAAISNARELLN